MTEAIFGLVGVIVGALVTGGVQYAQARQEERLNVRALSRVLADDLSGAAAVLADALESDDLENVGQLLSRVRLDTWDDNKLTFARLFTAAEWRRVSLGVRAVVSARRISSGGPDARVAAEDALDHLRDGHDELAARAGVTPFRTLEEEMLRRLVQRRNLAEDKQGEHDEQTDDTGNTTSPLPSGLPGEGRPLL